jgi:hypothetical protein
LIVSKGNYTADNEITLINNTFIRVDADNKYRPVILNNPDSLPVLVSGSTFVYRFVAYDPEDEDVSWRIDELAFSGMDELDAAINETFLGDGTSGPYTLEFTPASASRIVVQVNGVTYTASTDYTTIGDQLTFVSLTPATTDSIFIQYISTTTGYDSILFDQGASGLPSGLSINEDTGWAIGILPDQTEAQGQIRGLFRKRGSTPIRVNDIVILAGREFGTKTGSIPVYDVVGICDRKEALELSNCSKIPKWFVTSEVKKTLEGKVDVEENDDGLYDFDEEAPLSDESDDSKEESSGYKVDKKDKKDYFALAETKTKKSSDEIDIDNI